jgi:glycerol kinase
VKFWKSIDEIRGQWAVDNKFESEITDSEKETLLSGWNKAVSRSKNWEEH